MKTTTNMQIIAISILFTVAGVALLACQSKAPLPSSTHVPLPEARRRALKEHSLVKSAIEAWRLRHDHREVDQMLDAYNKAGYDFRLFQPDLAPLYAEMGELARAKAAYQRFMFGPGHHPIFHWVNYGELCERMNSRSDALDAYRHAVQEANFDDARTSGDPNYRSPGWPALPTAGVSLREQKVLALLVAAAEASWSLQDKQVAAYMKEANLVAPDTAAVHFARARRLLGKRGHAAEREFARAAALSTGPMHKKAAEMSTMLQRG